MELGIYTFGEVTHDPSKASLAHLANEHWQASYRALIESVEGEWQRFGAVDAFRSSVPLPFANGCLCLEPAKPEELEQAIRWVQDSRRPFRVRIADEVAAGVVEVPGRLGLKREEWDMPGMVLQPVPEPPRPAPGVVVSRVDRESHPDFIDVLIGSGFIRRIAQMAFHEALVDEPGVALFVARLDGVPAGTSLIMRTGDVSGVYAVFTAEEARRRGVAAATTWAAVAQAREWGSAAVILQSSPMGLPVYERIGFRTVVRYLTFVPIEGWAQVTQ